MHSLNGTSGVLAAGLLALSGVLLGCANGTANADGPEAASPRGERQTREMRVEPLPGSAADAVSGDPAGAVTGEVPAAMVERVRADLAARTGSAPISVGRAEAITWPDGSLGCPLPGQMYTQMLVPGYRVVFSAGGRDYDYHMAETGYFVLCEAGRIDGLPRPAPAR